MGENFRDHYAVRMVMRAKPGVLTLNELSRGPRLGLQIARWATGRPSILATAPSQVHVFWKSFEGLDQPDLQCVFTPGSYKQGATYVLDDYPGMTAGAWAHRPESTGYVRARSTDVFVDPVLQPNYLADADGPPGDARRHAPDPPPARHARTRGLRRPRDAAGPGCAERRRVARLRLPQRLHLLPPDRHRPHGAGDRPAAVVDDRLRVHGLTGLRVADASIMPSMPSANTYATTLMIAGKAADLIRGRTAMPEEAQAA